METGEPADQAVVQRGNVLFINYAFCGLNSLREFLHEIFFYPKLINNDFYRKEHFSEVVFHFHQPPDHKL